MGSLGRMGHMHVEFPNNVTIAVRSDGIFLNSNAPASFSDKWGKIGEFL